MGETMFYMRGDYPTADRNWRAEEERLRKKEAAKRGRADKAAQRKAARECHANPNDYTSRFDSLLKVGSRAHQHVGVADDEVTSTPDDDPTEHDHVTFRELHELAGWSILR